MGVAKGLLSAILPGSEMIGDGEVGTERLKCRC